MDVGNYGASFSRATNARRGLWLLAYYGLFRPSPKIFYSWRRFLLRLFGAKLGKGTYVHRTAMIELPWNLEMGDHSTIGPFVWISNAKTLRIGVHCVISQFSQIYCAGHDIELPGFDRIEEPVTIGDQVWVAAGAHINHGVTIGEGAVVGARAAVFKDVPAWTVVGGVPAKPIRKRVIKGGGGNPSPESGKQ